MSPAIISIITAIVTGLCTAIPSIIATVHTASVRDAVQNQKIDELTEKVNALSDRVEKYNDFDKRLAIIENVVFRQQKEG